MIKNLENPFNFKSEENIKDQTASMMRAGFDIRVSASATNNVQHLLMWC